MSQSGDQCKRAHCQSREDKAEPAAEAVAERPHHEVSSHEAEEANGEQGPEGSNVDVKGCSDGRSQKTDHLSVKSFNRGYEGAEGDDDYLKAAERGAVDDLIDGLIDDGIGAQCNYSEMDGNL